jgi:hypothetical protein
MPLCQSPSARCRRTVLPEHGEAVGIAPQPGLQALEAWRSQRGLPRPFANPPPTECRRIDSWGKRSWGQSPQMGPAGPRGLHQGRPAALPAPPDSARERPFPQEVKLLHNRSISVPSPFRPGSRFPRPHGRAGVDSGGRRSAQGTGPRGSAPPFLPRRPFPEGKPVRGIGRGVRPQKARFFEKIDCFLVFFKNSPKLLSNVGVR